MFMYKKAMEKLKDPFHRLLYFMFAAGKVGIFGGLVLGILVGVLTVIVDGIGTSTFQWAQALYFAVPSMAIGGVLGTVFGGVFGIAARKE